MAHIVDNNGKIIKSDNTYILKHSNEQLLINIMYQAALRVYDTKGKTFKDRDELANFLRQNLESIGFVVKPVGCTYCSLQEIKK